LWTWSNGCLRVLIPGALVYARPRMGKTHAIDYVCLHLERSRQDVLTMRMSCEHHRTDFEGPFFSALLIAAGATGQVLNTSITNKRQELIRRLRERLAARRPTSWCCSVMKPSANRAMPMNGCAISTISSPTTASG
jgi:hypothetical protein